jgi:hypothetical protein
MSELAVALKAFPANSDVLLAFSKLYGAMQLPNAAADASRVRGTVSTAARVLMMRPAAQRAFAVAPLDPTVAATYAIDLVAARRIEEVDALLRSVMFGCAAPARARVARGPCR